VETSHQPLSLISLVDVSYFNSSLEKCQDAEKEEKV
jgi:hypothetical protein